MNKFLVEFWGGMANGMRRYYNTNKAAVLAAKSYVRQNREKCPGDIYADIYEIDSFYKMHQISTIE